jgi:hypothetical protein
MFEAYGPRHIQFQRFLDIDKVVDTTRDLDLLYTLSMKIFDQASQAYQSFPFSENSASRPKV